MLETTIAGSLPKPAWLVKPRILWAPWQLDGEALIEAKRYRHGRSAIGDRAPMPKAKSLHLLNRRDRHGLSDIEGRRGPA